MKIDKRPVRLRREVRWFAERMELKLQQNDHKDGWQDCDDWWLLQRVSQEYDELRKATIGSCDAEKIADEAADVANFCMMIADNAAMRALKRRKVKRGKKAK